MALKLGSKTCDLIPAPNAEGGRSPAGWVRRVTAPETAKPGRSRRTRARLLGADHVHRGDAL